MAKMTQRFSMLALGLLLLTGCSKKQEPEQVPPSKTTPAASSKPRAPTFSRVTRSAPPESPTIDPATVPVAEDFRSEAEWKITKRSDLQGELNRIADELKPTTKDELKPTNK